MPSAQLCCAWRLCRVPQLLALLDAGTCFPAAPFNSEEALAALTRLGMQSVVGQESILQSARYIAELGLQNPDQAHERYLVRLNIPQCLLASTDTTLPALPRL